MSNAAKKYTPAIWVFLAYSCMWVAAGLEIWNMSLHPYDYGDGRLVSFFPAFCVFASIVYIIALIVLAARGTRKTLYLRLAMAAALPLVITLIIVAVQTG